MKTIIIVLMAMFILSGCVEKQTTETNADIVSIAGSWSGMGKSHAGTPMTLDFFVKTVSNKVYGNGSMQLAGHWSNLFYDIEGTIDGDQVTMIFKTTAWYVDFSGWVGEFVMMGQLGGLGATDGKIIFVRK